MSDHSFLHEDAELLQRIASGDERAFRIIFNRYHHKLGTYIYRVTRSHEMAQEITQDLFLKIWLNRESLTGVSNFKAYLFAASKNQAITSLKKIAREQSRVAPLESTFDMEHTDDADETQRYTLIDEAIDHLPPQQRQVYLLSRHERLKYAEIASRLSLSRETVKKYLQLSSESIGNYIRKRLITNILIFISIFI
ncbi:MAG: sigma-70 family RNA polymerase sigma factor [Dyadobacter sp.]|uniref:RNA polymerase sigma factor n=1 Tax=Dyadobacter sp. TaxID=1914288 RepID=UPI001B11A396|nr:sigma-70 family RNA polymerase sigma factor [Dyadobacter sp.]MBO9611263.1 sigma-70 family RNA polymerase sigma factor [Dyadobacter sp.]